MTPRIRVIWVLLVVLLMSLQTWGQTAVSTRETLAFTHLSEEDGLPHDGVNCIIQGSKGFMWFGSRGLCKYDGYRVKVYKPKTKYMRYEVHAICEDKEGMLWVGTLWAGIACFDPTTEQFTVYQHDPNDSKSLSDPRVTTIFEDSEGILWIGTPSRGLNRFDRATKTFTRYGHVPSDPNSLSSNVVKSIYEDRAGRLWVTTNRGLDLLDRSTGRFARYLHNPPDPYSRSGDTLNGTIWEDRDGCFWVGTMGSGIHHFDPDSGTFSRFPLDPNSSLPDNSSVSAVCEDRFGRVWFGTRKGLWRKDLDHKVLHNFRHDSTDPSSLSDDQIQCICKDRRGLLWIGTAAGGISRFDSAPKPFTVYQHDPKNAESLSHNRVTAISENHQEKLWIGTYGGGLNLLDRVTGQWLCYQPDPSHPHSLGSPLVSTVSVSTTGPAPVWIGTPASGLYRFDAATSGFERLRYDPNDGSDLGLNCINSLCRDRENILWIGTKNGLCWLDIAAKTFGRYRPDMSDPHRPIPVDVVAICEDRFGVLWIGSRGDGLYSLDRATDRFSCYRSDKNDPRTLTDDSVQVVHEDSRGMLWIGTRDGLNRLDRATESFTRFLGANFPVGEEDWQPYNDIRGIVEDNAGDLWVSTGRGIYILSNISSSGFRKRYYESLAGNWLGDFCVGATLKSSRGDLLFGRRDGLLAFHPKRMRNGEPPPVVLTDLKLNYESVPIRRDGSTTLVQHISVSEKITIGREVKALTLEFAALDFRYPEQNQYAYMLEGLIEDWVYLGGERSVTFTNLEPGDYVFRAKAAGSDGVWNEAGTSLSLIVTPLWWETTWFRVLAVVLIIGGIVGGFEGRVQLVKARRRSLEAQVAERTRQLQLARDDISQRKANEEALQRSEQQLRLITDSLPAMIAYVDSSLRYIFVNESYANFVGLPRDDIPGRRVLEVLGQDAFELIRDRIETVLLGQPVTFETTTSPSGTEPRHLLATYVPEFRGGKIQGFFASIHDVTELEKAKKQAREAHMTLYHFGRVKMLEALSSSLSHEMQQPLTGVLSNAQAVEMLLKDSRPDMEEVRDIVKDIVADTKRAGKVMWQLRAFLRKRDTDTRPLDLNSLIEDVLSVLNSDMVIHNVLVTRDLAADLPKVMGDDVQLKQVLMNLVLNAQQAMAESTRGLNRLVIRTSMDGTGKIAVAVEDSGPGIDEGRLEHIFEPFYTTKTEGTGVGLAISRFIIEAHGGQMWAGNQAEGGARVSFSLPVAGGGAES